MKDHLPHLEDGIGLWAQRLTCAAFPGSPALFLDRDGVVVEEVHFLSRTEDISLIDGIAGAIAAVNRAGIPVIVVSNQSGIARGYFDWPCFANVQAAATAQLAAGGARIDAVLACGYHHEGSGALGVADHAWRKPNAGMLHRAQELFGISLARSFIVGDRVSDLEAGAAAGLAAGALVMSGYGKSERGKLAGAGARWRAVGFAAAVFDTAPAAIAHFLEGLGQKRTASARPAGA